MRVERIGYEQCRSDKKRINAIYHANAIHYVVDGCGYYNGKLVTKGQCFLCHKNSRAEYYPDPKNPWTYYWIRFSEDGFDKFEAKCNFPYDGCFNFSHIDILEHLYHIYNDFGLEKINTDFSEKICELVVLLHSDYKYSSKNTQLVNIVKNYLNNNYYKKISIESLADKMNFSRGYLRYMFHKSEGMSIRQYLTNIRINRAKDLLKNSDYTITLIASSVGYDDIFQFSRFFISHVGCSPSKYRKKSRRE